MASENKLMAVANWKMYLSRTASLQVANSLAKILTKQAEKVDIVLCPSYPLISEVGAIFSGTKISVGAQDIFHEENGPFTGEVSMSEIQGLVKYTIVGHSERRKIHGDLDETVAVKAKLALKGGIHPIICVGETFQERKKGGTIEVLKRQVSKIMENLTYLDFPRVVFCYEPVWAIAPDLEEVGPQPEPQEVAEMAGLIRRIAHENGKYAEKIRVLYGGSVTSKTAAAFVSEPGVDGVLVGGASTKPSEFSSIIRELEKCR